MRTLIVGVDCAVQPERVGLACGTIDDGVLTLCVAEACQRRTNVADRIAHWIGDADRVLLALDAPLGWPQPLGAALASHAAGQAIAATANDLFRRETDRHVRRVYSKQSLDVGADRIARTARAALALLEDLRSMTSEVIPLAWDPNFGERVAAIEVYPAATLAACGFEHDGYRPAAGASARVDLIDRLSAVLHVDQCHHAMAQSTDACDAGICVLAGADFLFGRALPPEDADLARAEGWIWVRQPHQQPGT